MKPTIGQNTAHNRSRRTTIDELRPLAQRLDQRLVKLELLVGGKLPVLPFWNRSQEGTTDLPPKLRCAEHEFAFHPASRTRISHRTGSCGSPGWASAPTCCPLARWLRSEHSKGSHQGASPGKGSGSSGHERPQWGLNVHLHLSQAAARTAATESFAGWGPRSHSSVPTELLCVRELWPEPSVQPACWSAWSCCPRGSWPLE